MSSTSPSLQRIVSANTHISTLLLIASLLLTLMLLWHISTITLVENYGMPTWWTEAFLKEHARGWKVGVWVAVGVMVPVDVVHALLCLDWWCGVREEGGVGGEGEEREGVDDEKSCSGPHHDLQPRGSHTSTASPTLSDIPASAIPSTKRPYTHHPLLHPRLSPPTHLTLLTLFDTLMLLILCAHMTTYFASLPTSMAFCYTDAVLQAPAWEFGSTKKLLSMQDRCIGMNVDMHVAGGFAVFVALVLGVLHAAALGVRAGEVWVFGWGGVGGRRGAGCEALGREAMGGALSQGEMVLPAPASNASVSRVGSAASTTTSYLATRTSAEERSTGIGFVDGSAEQTTKRRADQTDNSEASKDTTEWSGVLLECLIDG